MSWQDPASAPLGETPSLWSILERTMVGESSSCGLCSGPVSCPHVLTKQPLMPVAPHRQKGRGCSGLGTEGRHSSWQVSQP